MKTRPFMFGVAAGLSRITDQDIALMKDAGIGFLRSGDLKCDLAALMDGSPQPTAYHALKEQMVRLRAAGFQFMGLTPSPRDIGETLGPPGSPEYFGNYARVCAHLAAEFAGLIDWWQVGNELDIWIFRDRLTLDESVTFLRAGIRAIKAVNPALKTGINLTLFPSLPGEVDGNTDAHEGVVLAQGIYGDPDLPVDYAGFDSYPGTWRAGGPESWDSYLEAFHRLTGKPIIIQEFGYSSAGELMNPEEIGNGAYPCEVRKWKHSWKGGHTQEIQADFLRESLRVFMAKPFVLGATYYNWREADTCWQCGAPDCPAETAWGLIDRNGRPKPSYAACREFFGTRIGKAP